MIKLHGKKYLTVFIVMLMMIVSMMPNAMAQEQPTRVEEPDRLHIKSAENSRAVTPGETLQLTAYDESQNPVEVDWSVDRETVATIDEHGLLKGIENGQGMVVMASLKSNPEIKATKTIAVSKGICQVIGGTYYDSLQAAIAATPTGGSIGLIRSIDLSEEIIIDKKLTISSIQYDSDEDTLLTILRKDSKANLKVVPGGSLTLKKLYLDGNKEQLGSQNGVTFLTIEKNAKATMNSDLYIKNMVSSNGPGAILNKGTLEIYEGIISSCVSLTDSGGIRNEGYLWMFGGDITNNTGVYGGGIYNVGTAELSSKDSNTVTIESNEVSENGGGIYNSGELTIQCATIIGNKSLQRGDGIYQDGILNLEDDDNPILIKDNIGDDLYLTTGKKIELNDINEDSMIYISSQEMGPGKVIDIIHQSDGKEITNSNLFIPKDISYSIDQKAGDSSTLQLNNFGKLYIGPDGDDNNDGKTANSALKSFDKAIEIGTKKRQLYLCVLPANEQGETAVLFNTFNLTKVTAVITSCDKNGEIIKDNHKANSITRVNPSATILLEKDSYVDINNVILDGGNLTANVPLITVIGGIEGQRLSLNTGSIIKNAKSSGTSGAMSIGQNGYVIMKEGSSILDCTATGTNSVGGIKIDEMSKGVKLEGGTISGNIGTTAGGIYQQRGDRGGVHLSDDGILHIADNFKANGEKSNLFIAANSPVLLETAKLAEGSNVGISSEVIATKENPIEVIVGMLDEHAIPSAIDINGFVSDSENYVLKYLDKETKNRIGLKVAEEFTITASATANGTITPSGNIKLKESQNQSFDILPNSSYEIADVVVDGKSIGAQESYTFENITENHSITASFQMKNVEKDKENIQTSVNKTGLSSAVLLLCIAGISFFMIKRKVKNM